MAYNSKYTGAQIEAKLDAVVPEVELQESSSGTATLTPVFGGVYYYEDVTSLTINAPTAPTTLAEKAKSITVRWNNASSAPSVTFNSTNFVWANGEIPEIGAMGEINIAYADGKFFCIGTSFAAV